MKAFLQRLKKLDAFAIIILIFIIVVAIRVITALTDNNSDDEFVPSDSEIAEQIDREVDEDFINDPELSPEDFPQSLELLSELPYISNDFSVNHLPLEEGEAPKIIVSIFTNEGEDKFEEWVSQYTYQTDIIFEFQYLIPPEYEGF